MRILGNPFIWLLRVRHRCGYGVHSPFAFRFITELCYEDLPFYAFEQLDQRLPLCWKWRRRKGLHLLFRLANDFQPHVISLLGDCGKEQTYLQQSCPNALLQYTCTSTPKRHLIYLREPHTEVQKILHSECVLILDNLHLHRKWFRELPSVVSFDLYDMGVAFFDSQYYKQNYIVNF